MRLLFLSLAIIMEVVGTSMLKITATRRSFYPVIGIILGYVISFYFLSLALRTIELSFGYAV